MFKIHVIFILLFHLIIINGSFSFNKEKSSEKFRTTFSFLIGFPFPSQSSGFMDVYEEKLGGGNDYFKPSALIIGKFLFPMSNKFDVGILWEYFSTSFRDYFSSSFNYFGNTITRNMGEKIDITTMPLLFIVDYSQNKNDYRSYFGAGAGVSFDDVYWFEEVNSNLTNDIRKSSEIYNSRSISPCFKLYIGLLLNFDKKDDEDFLGALHFEVSINYLVRSLKIYESFTKQFVKPPEEFYKTYLILPFYLSLSTGISFNLFHELKIKK